MFVPSQQLGVGHLQITSKERQYVNQVLDSNRLSYGPFSRRLEEMFARLHASRHAVLCNSGTSALQVSVAALMERDGWSEGDEILVPAITFVATANVVLMQNLVPVFVDVDPRTYNIDTTVLEEHLTDRTRAIIPVHMFGLPADMAKINAFASEHRLAVIEDSCETMFVTVDGKPVGAHGSIGCFSTYVAHFIVTGVGGLAITSDPELAVVLRSLCNHGRDGIYLSIDDDLVGSAEELAMVVSRRFNFVRLGYSYRVTELEAALGVAQLEDYESLLRIRQANASYLIERLRPLERDGLIQLPTVPAGSEHAFMIFPIMVTSASHSRDELAVFLEERLIETRPMMPLINQPFYEKRFGRLEHRYPAAAEINRSGFYIGCHHGFGRRELDYIAEAFASFFGVSL